MLDLASHYSSFVGADGCIYVELDKALYGCVESARLWFEDITGKLLNDGFVTNPYDECVFNKIDSTGKQITVTLYVDDLMATCANESSIDALYDYLLSVYPEVTKARCEVVDYLGRTIDFTTPGAAKVTMTHRIDGIIDDSKVTIEKPTPAADNLFEIREGVPKADQESTKYFRTFVAKVLYVAKRVRPECLTAVSFLSTRVNACDIDDLQKLDRLLGYILATRDRGIVLRIGDTISVNGYIDASYGVHRDARSHTGAVIVIGASGPIWSK